MTDYREEQCNEIEALESIYPDELTVVSNHPYCFKITISSQNDDDDTENASCVLQFCLPAKYPDEAPVVEVEEYDNIEDSYITDLTDFIKEQAEENLGEVMVFTLVSAVQERLTDLVEAAERERVEEIERKEKEKHAAEQKKFEGTVVTIETFLAWKAKFTAEMEELKRKRGEIKKECSKLSGRELFMTDNTLDDSDVKFLEAEGGDPVEVDESLFQDLDDLGLDDELGEDFD
ncbi:hypothetical protein NP493_803g00021 [Ridgeia piscesae]|uniref:RWD domain-containing protein n=1 Tax=Ridgeia piscesae TaxID=27915 RepID=A0AAD9KPT9_RIDPI|nr:hypothetical protein NP493_803g00021 [Ridgeia piscesae]